jgi:PAS domain S-box-containing protein
MVMSEPEPVDIPAWGDDINPAELVMSQGDAQRVGRFRFYLADQRWEWSDAVARMHGYEPGTVEPTTELLLKHKHPDDRPHVAAMLERVRQGEPFSSRHRIIDTAGHTRWMIVVGDLMHDEAGVVTGTSGFYVDVTESLQSDISAAVSEVAASRAVIERAKGVLMAVYGIGPDIAWDILVWRSQEANIKVRDLASRFMDAVAGTLPGHTQRQVDHILLSIK